MAIPFNKLRYGAGAGRCMCMWGQSNINDGAYKQGQMYPFLSGIALQYDVCQSNGNI